MNSVRLLIRISLLVSTLSMIDLLLIVMLEKNTRMNNDSLNTLVVNNNCYA